MALSPSEIHDLHKELSGECHAHDCTEKATHIVYWPGKTTKQCEYHAKNAVSVAMAMGFSLTVEETK